MSAYLIRKAEEKDCEQIMKLIMELAQFENMPEQVGITADVLREDGFGTDRCFHCLVAEQNPTDGAEDRQRIIGYCLFYYIYSTWERKCCYMEDLYVTPESRSQGIGTALWAEVTKIALSKGCSQLRWTALDWNTNALELYKRHGGVNMTETTGYQLFRMTKSVMENFVAQRSSQS